MKYTKFFRTLAVAIILAMLVVVIPASPALAQRISLDDDKGEIGDRIDIDGYDFDLDTTVYIYFSSEKAKEGDEIDDEVDDYYERVKTKSIDAYGDLDTYFSVPSKLNDGDNSEDVHGGTYYVYVTYSDDKDIIELETFTVIAGDITISPDNGAVGTKVKITGTGFGSSEDIDVEYDNADVDIESGDKKTDSSGDFTTYILIPESAAGDHTIDVGDESGSTDEDTFTVEPEMTIDVTSGKAGDTVTVSGTGFGGSATVTVDFDGDEVATDDADSDGSFEISFTVPAVAPGTYDVEVEDDDNNSGEATFTIAANLSISPVTSQTSPGHVGMDMTISGTGFTPNTAVTVTYASASEVVATPTTDANGAFSATFKVPASEGGSHTITATDGTNTLTGTFTMESDAPAAPVPLLPAMGIKAEQPVKFDWEDVTDDSLPVTYTLQIATDEDFTDIELEKEGLTESKYTLTKELESTKKDAPYWWRVKAIDGASNESGWSGAGSFAVGFVFAMPDWAQYLLWALGGLVLLFIGFLLGRRTGYSY